MSNEALITELKAENNRLRADLEKASEKELDAEESGRAMLFMLEDLGKSRDEIERAKLEWEETFDAISDPLFIHDRKFKVVRANRAYSDVAGMEFKEFMGRPYYEVFPKMDGPFKMCRKAQELQEEFFYPLTNRIFKVRFYPINDVNGGYLYSIHILEDITEAKRAEEKIREAEARYRLLFEQSPAGVVIYDPITLLPIEFNDQMCSQLGYSREEFSRLAIPAYEAVETPEEIKVHADKVLREGHDTFERKHKTKTGEIRNALISVKLINLSGKVLLYCIIRDIKEMKMAEEKIKQEMEITTHLLMIADATAHTTDADKLMEQVMHCGHEIMKCDVYLSYIWDSETRVFRPSQAFGLSHELIPLFKTESLDMKVGFIKEAMKKKEPTLTLRPLPEGEGKTEAPSPLRGEGWGEGKVFSWLPDINTLAVIPLIGKKGPLGLIVGIYTKTAPHLHPLPMRGEEIKGVHPLPEGEGKTPAPSRGGLGRGWGEEAGFTDRDMKIMQGIMHQVSVALEQASLYKESVEKGMELSHRIETIQVMHEIDRSILSTLESEEILETVTRMVARIIPCERATVVLVDRERGGFLYVAGFGVTFVPKGTFVPFGDSSAKEVIETGRTEYVSNLSEVKELLPLERRFLEDGFLSHVRVPLTVKGEVTGILTVGAKRAAAFAQEDLSTLEKLAYQIGVALSNARLISDLEELFLGTVKSLSSAIDAKSPWTSGHSERVTKYALDIAREMGLVKEDIKALELAGLLHDIGKIGTYDILLDKPGRLEPDEIEIVRRHPGKGAEILEPIRRFKNIIPAIKHHHEFYDGTGYPDRLKGEEIPLLARILTVADTFDAMKADRPYRTGRTMEFMISELKRCSGTQFDPKVVEAFLKVIGEREELKMAAN